MPDRALLLSREFVPSAWWRTPMNWPWAFVPFLLYFVVNPKLTRSPPRTNVPPPVAKPRLGSKTVKASAYEPV